MSMLVVEFHFERPSWVVVIASTNSCVEPMLNCVVVYLEICMIAFGIVD